MIAAREGRVARVSEAASATALLNLGSRRSLIERCWNNDHPRQPGPDTLLHRTEVADALGPHRPSPVSNGAHLYRGGLACYHGFRKRVFPPGTRRRGCSTTPPPSRGLRPGCPHRIAVYGRFVPIGPR